MNSLLILLTMISVMVIEIFSQWICLFVLDSTKTKNLTISDIFGKQLIQIRGISPSKAQAIVMVCISFCWYHFLFKKKGFPDSEFVDKVLFISKKQSRKGISAPKYQRSPNTTKSWTKIGQTNNRVLCSMLIIE